MFHGKTGRTKNRKGLLHNGPRHMTHVYLILFASSLLAVFGQLCLKLGSGHGALMKILWSPWLWGGLVSYFCSMVLWVYALTKVRLGIAYAFTSLTFVGVYVASFFILKESVTLPKLLALALIVTGFLILTKWG